ADAQGRLGDVQGVADLLRRVDRAVDRRNRRRAARIGPGPRSGWGCPMSVSPPDAPASGRDPKIEGPARLAQPGRRHAVGGLDPAPTLTDNENRLRLAGRFDRGVV